MYLDSLEFLEEERDAWAPFEALAELTDEQHDRILTIAHKCPVHRALLGSNVEIDDSFELTGG